MKNSQHRSPTHVLPIIIIIMIVIIVEDSSSSLWSTWFSWQGGSSGVSQGLREPYPGCQGNIFWNISLLNFSESIWTIVIHPPCWQKYVVNKEWWVGSVIPCCLSWHLGYIVADIIMPGFFWKRRGTQALQQVEPFLSLFPTTRSPGIVSRGLPCQLSTGAFYPDFNKFSKKL